MDNKKIRAVFSWEGYPKQRSGGLIGNLLSGELIATVDCDASAIACNESGIPIPNVLKDSVAYYDNPNLFDGAIIHEGDNISNGTNSEAISIAFDNLPEYVSEIALTLDVFKSKDFKKASFGRTHNQSIKIYDAETDEELEGFNYLGIPARGILLCGKLKKLHDGKWIYVNIGKQLEGYSSKQDLLALNTPLVNRHFDRANPTP